MLYSIQLIPPNSVDYAVICILTAAVWFLIGIIVYDTLKQEKKK